MCQHGFEHFVGLSLVRDKALETTEAQITELLASANVVGLIHWHSQNQSRSGHYVSWILAWMRWPCPNRLIHPHQLESLRSLTRPILTEWNKCNWMKQETKSGHTKRAPAQQPSWVEVIAYKDDIVGQLQEGFWTHSAYQQHGSSSLLRPLSAWHSAATHSSLCWVAVSCTAKAGHFAVFWGLSLNSSTEFASVRFTSPTFVHGCRKKFSGSKTPIPLWSNT